MCELYQFKPEMQPARPFPPPGDPREQAVIHEDTCTACGCPTVDHFGGCTLARKARTAPQSSWPLGLLYGDPHRDVTEAITLALEDSCGPAVAVLFESLGNDERLMLARELSRAAVSAHLAELAK